MGLNLMPDRVRSLTHCAIPPLHIIIVVYLLI